MSDRANPPSVEISINDSTILLVAEILRQERGLKDRPYHKAATAISNAIKALQGGEQQEVETQ